MLPSRYTKKETPSPLVQKLLDAHVIGLLIDEDFKYDAAKRVRERPPQFHDSADLKRKREWKVRVAPLEDGTTVTQRTLSAEESEAILRAFQATGHFEVKHQPKIKNYAIFRPYGMGSKLFLHGKDIFTPDAAVQFYHGHKREESLFNFDVIKKIEQTFLPTSFADRAGNYYFAQKMTNTAMLIMAVDFAKEQYPHIDFSSLPNPDNFTLFASKFMSILEKNGVDIAQMLQDAQTNTSRYTEIVKKRIRDEMPAKVDEYLASSDAQEPEIQLKKERGKELKSYMSAHEWDWEILENFKAAAHSKTDAMPDTIEELLQIGARNRAVQALRSLAEGMTNPYDERFIQPEQSMARILADSVQPVVLQHALKDKTALLFSSSGYITAFNDDFEQLPDGAYGKYHPNAPRSDYFSNFLLFANHGLSHSGLAYIARHEFEHKVDVDGGIIFATRFKETIPDMIAEDVRKLGEMEAFIREVNTESPQADIQKLLVLGKKRGLKVKPDDIEALKEGLIGDISHIKDRLAVFALDLNHRAADERMYANTFTQWLEIPAVIEELKGQFGRLFIGDALPQLAKATDSHRMQVLAPGRKDDSAPSSLG